MQRRPILGTGRRSPDLATHSTFGDFQAQCDHLPNACLAADSSPIWTKSKALSARFTTESPCCVRHLREDTFNGPRHTVGSRGSDPPTGPARTKKNSPPTSLGDQPPRRSILGQSKKSFQARVTRTSSPAAYTRSASVNA